ncbi:MAG: hypothetical protein LBS06_03775 [Treponema sp.]|jgi:hypothetical protein|nr:hypothetical protein [Treponema sp.]
MNGKRAVFCALILLLFAAARELAAQEAGPVFRRLSWQPVEYASGYEVAVEILTASNEWVEQFRKTGGTETFADCPLFIGKYRFRVSALDLLGRPGPVTEWVYFELKAREPEPVVEQESVPEPPPQAAATEQDGAGSPPTEEAESPRPLPAAAPSPEDEESLFTLELFYTPLVTLSFSSFNEIYATEPFQPVGFAARFSFHPFKDPAWGFGLAPFWNFLSTEIYSKSRYTHISGGHLFAVWRIRPTKREAYITVRAGGGYSYVSSRFDFNDGLDIKNQYTGNPSAIIGVSFQGRLSGSLFLDAGVEYFHIFSKDNPLLSYLRPMIGIGWRF